jgi:hypothetical protein
MTDLVGIGTHLDGSSMSPDRCIVQQSFNRLVMILSRSNFVSCCRDLPDGLLSLTSLA